MNPKLKPYGICWLAGIGMGLANAPTGFWGLAWFAMIPLWLVVWHRIEARSITLPLPVIFWGLGYHGWTLFWITRLHPLTWMGIPWSASVAIAVFCWLFITLWGTALVMLWSWLMIAIGVVPFVHWPYLKRFFQALLRNSGKTSGKKFEADVLSASPKNLLNFYSRFHGNQAQENVPPPKAGEHPCTELVRKPLYTLLFTSLLPGIALWCVLETVWSWGPLYWGGLGLTQSPDNLAILHLGQVAGPNAIVAAIVAVNGLLARILYYSRLDFAREGPTTEGLKLGLEQWPFQIQPPSLQGSPDGIRGEIPLEISRKDRLKILKATVLLLLTLHLWGGLLYSRALNDAPETALKIGLVQGNIPTRIKLTGEGLKRAIEHYTQGYENLTEQGVDAVLMPEGALPFVWTGFNRQSIALYQAIRDRGVPVWLGTFLSAENHKTLSQGLSEGLSEGNDYGSPEGDRYTQSLVTETGDTIFSRYNKVKLVPLGEYIPFESVFGQLIGALSAIESSLVPGQIPQTFETPWGRAAVAICYEPPFSHLIRQQVLDGGQFILTASNLDPYNTVLMAQHEALAVMRAIEGDRWLVQATNTGYSSFIDPHGHVYWRSKPYEFVAHAETIYRRQNQTLYTRLGNWLTLVLGIAGLFAVLIINKGYLD